MPRSSGVLRHAENLYNLDHTLVERIVYSFAMDRLCWSALTRNSLLFEPHGRSFSNPSCLESST
jgi:hypothetical protein